MPGKSSLSSIHNCAHIHLHPHPPTIPSIVPRLKPVQFLCMRNVGNKTSASPAVKNERINVYGGGFVFVWVRCVFFGRCWMRKFFANKGWQLAQIVLYNREVLKRRFALFVSFFSTVLDCRLIVFFL